MAYNVSVREGTDTRQPRKVHMTERALPLLSNASMYLDVQSWQNQYIDPSGYLFKLHMKEMNLRFAFGFHSQDISWTGGKKNPKSLVSSIAGQRYSTWSTEIRVEPAIKNWVTFMGHWGFYKDAKVLQWGRSSHFHKRCWDNSIDTHRQKKQVGHFHTTQKFHKT